MTNEQQAVQLQIGQWQVEPARNTLRHCDGRSVRIESRSMRVLELLAAHAGEVVATEQILDAVWGRRAVSSHSVAIVISDLRKALGDAARAPRFIETIPKRGYRLRRVASNRPPSVGERRLWPMRVAGLAAVASTFAGFALQGRSLPAHAPVVDRELQERYFQARQLWSRRDGEGTAQALQLLQQIVTAQADFAPAHAALADIYAHKTGAHLGQPALDTFRAAQRHLDRALALAPHDAEAQVTQALLYFYRDHQPAKALSALDRALAAQPQLSLAWQSRAMVLSAVGAHAQSIEAIRRAAALDPVSASIGWDEVWFLYLADRYTEAAAAARRASEYSPPNLLYAALLAEARHERRAAVELWLLRLERRGLVLQDPAAVRTAAERAPADGYRALLDELSRQPQYREHAGVVAIWQLLGEQVEAALTTLESAPPDRDNWLQIWLHEMPVLRPLAAEPRFQAIVARTGIRLAAD